MDEGREKRWEMEPLEVFMEMFSFLCWKRSQRSTDRSSIFPLVAPVEMSATLQLLSYSTTTDEIRFLEMFGIYFAVDILCFCFLRLSENNTAAVNHCLCLDILYRPVFVWL